MKRCPNCNQTFEEDWLSFCTQDGTTLVEESTASSEPPPTMMAPPPNLALPNEQASWNPPASDVAPSPPRWEQPITPAWQPPPPPTYVQQANKSLAVASMVIGIVSVTVGWLCLGPIPGIAAIILGAVALSQIKKNPDRVGGKQFAWTGVITGSITVLIYTILMIIYIVAIIATNA
jgi:hypothetical protein